MKTTIDLPDELVAEIRQLARAEGVTMGNLVEEALRWVIAQRRAAGRFTLRDASVAGEGLSGSFAGGNWAQLRAAAYGDQR